MEAAQSFEALPWPTLSEKPLPILSDVLLPIQRLSPSLWEGESLDFSFDATSSRKPWRPWGRASRARPRPFPRAWFRHEQNSRK
jgi:hypothetical protein